ncbi:MAG TPA: hypothetical protein VMH47_08315 [Gaiellaceae bacterium]|nr:hypothetical protein [Gaiellaceae bacterium]
MPLYFRISGQHEPVPIPDTLNRAQLTLEALVAREDSGNAAVDALIAGRDWIEVRPGHVVARQAITDVFVANED